MLAELGLVIQKIHKHVSRWMLANGLARTKREKACLSWAIVGTGYMASVWGDLLLRSGENELSAVCSRTTQAGELFAKKFGCNKFFASIEEMLEAMSAELDFVYVATPLSSHCSIIEKCVKAGVNVLTEKPATDSPEEWAELTKLAKKHRVILIEGMWMRCLPTFKQAEQWVAQGKIGRVHLIKADLYKFQPRVGVGSSPDKGLLMDYGVYALSFVCTYLKGIPEWCESWIRYDSNGDDADLSIVSGRDGVFSVINLSSNFHGSSGAAVIGDRGMIEWANPFNRSSVISLYDFATGAREVHKFRYIRSGFEYELEEVVRTFREGLCESSVLNHRTTYDTLVFAKMVRELCKST